MRIGHQVAMGELRARRVAEQVELLAVGAGHLRHLGNDHVQRDVGALAPPHVSEALVMRVLLDRKDRRDEHRAIHVAVSRQQASVLIGIPRYAVDGKNSGVARQRGWCVYEYSGPDRSEDAPQRGLRAGSGIAFVVDAVVGIIAPLIT